MATQRLVVTEMAVTSPLAYPESSGTGRAMAGLSPWQVGRPRMESCELWLQLLSGISFLITSVSYHLTQGLETTETYCLTVL